MINRFLRVVMGRSVDDERAVLSSLAQRETAASYAVPDALRYALASPWRDDEVFSFGTTRPILRRRHECGIGCGCATRLSGRGRGCNAEYRCGANSRPRAVSRG